MSNVTEQHTTRPVQETATVFEEPATAFEYVRPLRPLHFPEEAEVPESQHHLELRTILYQLLSSLLEGRASVGSDQFLYFDASDPHQCLAPDVFVKLGGGQEAITSWKVWERGTPELAIEITSRSDAAGESFASKLRRYHKLGIRELVFFDQDAESRVRVWDYVDGDLIERRVEVGACVPCRTLGLYWVTVSHQRWGFMLRLARDARGHDLIKTQAELHTEAMQREAEAKQREAEAKQREAEAKQREAEAQRRIAELEAQLAQAKASQRDE